MNSTAQSAYAMHLMVSHRKAYCAIVFAISLVGIVGNIFVIVAHIKDPLKCFKTSSSSFIVNIAVIDLMVTTYSAVAAIVMFGSYEIYLLTIQNQVFWLVTNGLINTSFPAYVCLAIERFCSIVFPLWHRVKFTTRRIRCWLGLMWIIHAAYVSMSSVFGQTFTRVTDLAYTCLLLLCTQLLYLGTNFSIKRQRKELLSLANINESTLRFSLIHILRRRGRGEC